MSPSAPAAPALPFFLETAAGRRFCLYHAAHGATRAALVYVPPFAEEMNRSRRMAALAARALAANGVAVLMLDLHGCGDSAGEFHEARWDGWLDDIAAARSWLEERTGLAAGLWGLRLGALLAAAAAQQGAAPPTRLLLWQPVTAGLSHLNHFLRLRLAADMLQEGVHEGMDTLRASLARGATLEIAGYELSAQLAEAIAVANASQFAPRCRVDWFELAAAPDRPIAPAASRLATAWRLHGADVRQQLVEGPQFWATPELSEAPALLRASVACFAEAEHA